MSDALALSWLDRLLSLSESERSERLLELEAGDPLLHARLCRLLRAALASDNSQILVHPAASVLAASDNSPADLLQAGQLLGGYRLVRELGRGGMSVVWLANRVDGMLDRPVAIKLPLLSLTSPVDIRRFAQEKDVLAVAAHPHIARLYDAGITASGQPFIVLEYLDGESLTAHCDHQNLGIEERLRLFLQVCAAVDYAHRHLVVHRDLKPSNILVGSDGIAKLLDFGVAKLLGVSGSPINVTAMTLLHVAALTPSYAAPEQVSGGAISIGTDVYSLGVLLHELLTGQLPYPTVAGQQPHIAHLLNSITLGNTTLPSRAHISPNASIAGREGGVARLRSRLAGDLDTIVGKAMRLHPEQRYSSAETLTADVRSYLEKRPIMARRRNWRYSLRLFLLRHRAAAAITAAVLIMFLLAAGAAFQQYLASRQNAERAAVVRDFMFDLIDDAEPAESQESAEVTGRQMIDGAVIRAQRQFSRQPQLQGELLSELGRMYSRIDQPVAAQQTLSAALELLEQQAPDTDPALNRTRALLAALYLDEGNVSGARALATKGRQSCIGSDPPCAKARAYSDVTLSRLELMDGNVERSLQSIREAAKETELAFGPNDPETVMALVNLASLARNAGYLLEASRAIDRATAIGANQLLKTADRATLTRTAAVLDFDMGRYASSFGRLTQLLKATHDRAEQALQHRLLANVSLALGEPAAALQSAEAALSLADLARVSAESLFAKQAHSQALTLLDRADEGLAEIQEVIGGLRKMGRSDLSPEVIRARRIHAELLLRAGQPASALAALESLTNEMNANPASAGLEPAQVSELRACALRELNRLPEALELHQSARMQFLKQLPEGHPFLNRNRLYTALASGNASDFHVYAERVKSQLSASSVWVRMIDTKLAPTASCAAKGLCIFIL